MYYHSVQYSLVHSISGIKGSEITNVVCVIFTATHLQTFANTSKENMQMPRTFLAINVVHPSKMKSYSRLDPFSFIPNFKSIRQTIQLGECEQTDTQADTHAYTDGTNFITSSIIYVLAP